MKSIKAEFFLNVECNEDKTGHSDSQTGDVDKRISFVPSYISQGDPKKVFKHDKPPIEDINHKHRDGF